MIEQKLKRQKNNDNGPSSHLKQLIEQNEALITELAKANEYIKHYKH